MSPPWLSFATPIAAGDDAGLAQALALLDAEEIARADRFVFDKDRRRFVTCRALVRRILSEHAAVDPGDWRFAASAHGRPEIAYPAEGAHLRFSASRTDGLVMCAVSEGAEIGADLERVRPYPAAIVERHFSRAEAEAIRRTPQADRSELFFRSWTLKEAYCKARGLGLAIPLAEISFAVDGEHPTMTARPADDRTDWHLRVFPPRQGFMAAICVETRQDV